MLHSVIFFALDVKWSMLEEASGANRLQLFFLFSFFFFFLNVLFAIRAANAISSKKYLLMILYLDGSVINYSENKPRKQWNKETPQTLMNFLSNAEISLAFKTYTIYKAGKSPNGFVNMFINRDLFF